MKKYFIIICLVIVFFGAKVEANETCEIIEQFAEIAMKYRQSGHQMSSFWKKIEEEDTGAKDDLAPYYKSILIEAYKKPRFSTQDYQDRAVRDFKNKQYLRCIEILRK